MGANPDDLVPSGTAGPTAVRRAAASERWRRYPPLLSLAAALAIAVLVLPSSLHLPQTEPTETLEYAPVTPEDDEQPPPAGGDLASLGLATSPGVGAAGEGPGGDGGPPPPVGTGRGENPAEYRCVGDPPRQTEDPLSPPCVPFFEGDNFGATYQGVEGEEIRLALYFDGGPFYTGTSRGEETCGVNKLIDLVNDPPTDDECHFVRLARIWQRYFNLRYQTYDRFAHLFVYFGTNAATATPETRRADAGELHRRVRPFATIDFSQFGGGGDEFVDTLARRGVLNFGSFVGHDSRFFQRYPRLIWGYAPALELQADAFSTVLCRRYVGRHVDHSPEFAGRARRFGLVYTTDPGYETLRRIKDRVLERFEGCGGTLATSPRTFPTAGYAVDTSTSPRYALEAMQAFQRAGVTTVIWPGGMEPNFTKAARQLSYQPEWVVLGDGQTDNELAQQGQGGTQGQDQLVWSSAAVVTYQPQWPVDITAQICFQAQRSVDPQVPPQDASFGCDMYPSLRQLFIGIQVAGPRLGPTSIDRGFHAIPAVPSRNLQVPACYYDPGDYTCVKDIVLTRWDPVGHGTARAASPGCYRIVGARRVLPRDLTTGDAMAGYDPARDPCLGYTLSVQRNTGPPDPTQL